MRHFRTGKSDRIGWFGQLDTFQGDLAPLSVRPQSVLEIEILFSTMIRILRKSFLQHWLFWLKWVLTPYWSMVVIFTFSSSQAGFGLQRSVSGISINIWTMLALRSCVSGVFINNYKILDLGLAFPQKPWQYLTWAWHFHNEYPDNAGSAGEDWMALRAPSYWHVMLSRHTGDTQWGSTT